MVSINSGDWRPSRPGEGDNELEQARALAAYVDGFAAGEIADNNDFLARSPHLAAMIPVELETLEELGSLVDARETSRTFGDFQVLREVGRGGMGIVYEARQISINRRVALKTLPSGLLGNPKAVARFEREPRVAASLHHPNIVEVYATGVEGGTPYFAMEFAVGEDLDKIQRRMRWATDGSSSGEQDAGEAMRALLSTLTLTLAQQDASGTELLPPFEPTQPSAHRNGHRNGVRELTSAYYLRLAKAFASAADGLQHAHTSGVVHRDLKPSNLLLDSSGTLRILDFGLAWAEDQPSLTASLEPLGTPSYMSPEQAQGFTDLYGPATDIYSLGATLYALMAWRPPFEAGSVQEIRHKIIHEEPRPLRRIDPHAPRDLETIVMKCLRKDPRERYGSAETLAQDLRRFVRGDLIQARALPVSVRVARRAWRGRKRIAEVVGALGLLLAVSFLFVIKPMQERAEANVKTYRGLLQDGAMMLFDRRHSPISGMGRVDGEVIGLENDASSRQSVNEHSGGSQGLIQSRLMLQAGAEPVEFEDDSTQAAIGFLEKAVKVLPGRPEAYYYQARGFLIQGRRVQAREALDKSIAMDKRFIPALALRASVPVEGADGGVPRDGQLALQGAGRRLEKWEGLWVVAHDAEVQRNWAQAAEAYGELTTSLGQKEEPFAGLGMEALFGSGVARFNAGDFDQAELDFVGCKRYGGDWVLPKLFIGTIQLLKGKTAQAEGVFREIHGSQPSISKPYVAQLVVAIYGELGDFQRALDWSDKMSAGPVKTAQRIDLLCRLKRGDEALTEGEEAVKLYPGSIPVQIAMGDAFKASGRFEEAERQYVLAVSLDRGDVRPLLSLAVCLEADGKLDGAEQILRKATELDADSGQAHYNLARFLSQRGRIEEAKQVYLQTIEIQPGHALAHNNLGTLLDREGKRDEAFDKYSRAVQLAPMLGLAHYNMAWVFHRRRSFSLARLEYEKARDLGVKDAVLYKNLAPCLQYEDKKVEALQAYYAALEIDRKDALTYHSLGTLLDRQGRLEDARDAYRRAVDLRPQWVDAHNDLGNAFDQLDSVDEAIPEYRKAIAIDTKFPWAHNNLAVLLLRARRPLPAGEDLVAEVKRLEAAGRLPAANAAVRWLLEKYRAALLPDLATYASIDALLDGAQPVIEAGEAWRFFRGKSEPSEGILWTEASFDDASWESDRAPFGYPAKDGMATLLEDMPAGYSTLYVRRRFTIADPGRIQKLLLSLRVDDGFVAYLNGQEVARFRAGNDGQRLDYDAVADSHEREHWAARDFWLDPRSLQAGENVLAVQGLNANLESEDFSLDQTLQAVYALDAERLAELEEALTAFESQSSAEGRNAAALLAYFEGRLLEQDGSYREAEGKYLQVAAVDASGLEPRLRIAARRVALGNADAAERYLIQELASGPAELLDADQLWDKWLRISLVDLRRGPGEALARILELERDAGAALEGRPADFIWLLGELNAGRAVRINCAGRDFTSQDGQSWSRDKFFLGGYGDEFFGDLGDRLESLEEPTLYQTARSYIFESAQRIPGYRVPLPVGNYRVTLHFLEGDGRLKKRGERRFDVLLEGTPVLPGYEPDREGFGVPDPRPFDVAVTDGALDIDFVRRSGNPVVCGIEIERL